MNEKTPKKITRKELYDKFPYLQNISMNEMINLISACSVLNSDEDLIYYIKCYMHSYPELSKTENLNKIFSVDENEK